MPSRNRLVFAILVLALAAMIAVFAVINGGKPAINSGKGEALIGGPFTLTDQSGRQVTDQDFKGRYMLILFGYTHCPDICPAQLKVVTAALDQLRNRAGAIQPIFISVDPERDTPRALRTFLATYGPRFLGLTGTPRQIEEAAKAYHVQYARAGASGSPNYLMTYTVITYLMDPRGRFLRHFPYTTDPAELAMGIADAMASSP